MTFFDKKEDVMKINLTSHGKHLVSKGKYKPVYYSFHDDEIIYDMDCMKGGTELQNDIEGRIEETVIFRDVESLETKDLGNSSLSKETFPSWRVKFARGLVSGSSEVYEMSGEYDEKTYKIPQIDLDDLEVVTYIGNEVDDELNGVVPEVLEYIGDDGEYLGLERKNILFSIQEDGVDTMANNFEVEVFIDRESDCSPGGCEMGVDEVLERIEFGEDGVEEYLEVLCDSEIGDVVKIVGDKLYIMEEDEVEEIEC